MINLIKGFVTAISMFTIIPAKAYWEEKSLTYIMLTLPLVGAITGVLWYAVSSAFEINIVLLSALCILFPMFFTGFIHFDGYMDTCDAISSRQDMEKMQKILKDSNVGAFAVIYSIVIVLCSYCSFYVLLETKANLIFLIYIPIISRCVSSLLLFNIEPISKNSFSGTFKNNTNRYHSYFVLAIMASTYIVASFTLDFKGLLALILVGIIGILMGRHLVKKLGGICGDICGCIVVVMEALLLLFMAL